MAKKQQPSFWPSMTDTGVISIANIAAISLRNAGDATVNLAGGLWTLDSKETLSINVTQDDFFLTVDTIQVTFDTSTGTTKKLQILVVKTADC